MLNRHKQILTKIIVTSFLLFLTFIFEIISHYTINFHVPCDFSFFKIELLFIILIGFLFKFKYGFFASLIYLLIHYAWEFYFISFFFSDSSHEHSLNLATFFYRFFLPYIVCSSSGLFYQKKSYIIANKKTIITVLLLISLIQFISSFLFIDYLQKDFIKEIPLLKEIISYSIIFNIVYSLISVTINNIIIGFFLNNIINRLKDHKEILEYLKN